MAARFPQYKYGGSAKDYVIEYYHADSGRFFKTLADARKYAIAYSIKNPSTTVTDPWGRPTEKWAHAYIDEVCFYKYRPGTSLTYKQESGPRRLAGFVDLEATVDGKIIYVAWRDRIKSDSRIIDKNGKVVRKMTSKELRRY